MSSSSLQKSKENGKTGQSEESVSEIRRLRKECGSRDQVKNGKERFLG